MNGRLAFAAALCLAGLAVGQHDDDDGPCRDLARAQDEGRFDVAAAVQALAAKDDELARTAAAIVRHEWLELPPELFARLDAGPQAAERLLAELARAPRPAARAWAARHAAAAPGRSLDHRLLALAARGEPLSGAEALLLLEALRRGELGEGFHLVLPLLPQHVADALLGRLHQGLAAAEFDVDQLVFVLDRLSPRGIEILLGLIVSLPESTARVLCRRVDAQLPRLVADRVAAALDGAAPLDPLWLDFSKDLLDRPARIARVRELLRDGATPELRDRAFDALLRAKVVDEATLAIALDGPDGGDGTEARALRVLSAAPERVPENRLIAWLVGPPNLAAAAARALVMRPGLSPRLMRTLLAELRGVEAVSAGVAFEMLTALVVRGDAAALGEILPQVFASAGWPQLLDRLGHRSEPFVYELLLQQLARAAQRERSADGAPGPRPEQLDMVRLLLCGFGDRRELATLVQHAPARDAAFLRRCRQYAAPLAPEQALALGDAALTAADPDIAAELLEWAAADRSPATAERLWRLVSEPPENTPAAANLDALREVALRLAATGPHRAALVDELRAAWAAGPLPEALSALPYELLNGMPEPLRSDDLRLCAEIVLRPPLGDPDGERELVRRWPDGDFGFPLVAAVATRLRGASVVEAERAFAQVVADCRADPRAPQISPQRLLVFWRALSIVSELQDALGRATVSLWHADDAAAAAVAAGPAAWFAARAAEVRGEFAVAAAGYRRAIAALLRLPGARREARWLLGDRDPGRGDDPWAALAAAPYRMRRLDALRVGDEPAAAAAAAAIREFAGHDAPTLATLQEPVPESGR